MNSIPITYEERCNVIRQASGLLPLNHPDEVEKRAVQQKQREEQRRKELRNQPADFPGMILVAICIVISVAVYIWAPWLLFIGGLAVVAYFLIASAVESGMRSSR